MTRDNLPPLSPLEEQLLRYLRHAMNDGVVPEEDFPYLFQEALRHPQLAPEAVLAEALANLERLGLARKLQCWQHVVDPEASA